MVNTEGSRYWGVIDQQTNWGAPPFHMFSDVPSLPLQNSNKSPYAWWPHSCKITLDVENSTIFVGSLKPRGTMGFPHLCCVLNLCLPQFAISSPLSDASQAMTFSGAPASWHKTLLVGHLRAHRWARNLLPRFPEMGDPRFWMIMASPKQKSMIWGYHGLAIFWESLSWRSHWVNSVEFRKYRLYSTI